MKLLLIRIAKRNTYTIGRLYINNEYFCDTIEDKDRGLTLDTPLDQIKKVKVKNETAIPIGTYEITMNVVSPKYSKSDYYVKLCNARVPRLLNVPGFDGILIHTGNTASQSSGCILVGYNTVVGKVMNSKKAFELLYRKLKLASDNNEKITITIQ